MTNRVMEAIKIFNLTIFLNYIFRKLLIHIIAVIFAAALSRVHTGKPFRPLHQFIIHIIVTTVIAFGVSEMILKVVSVSITVVISFLIGLSTDHIASIALSERVQKNNAENIWSGINSVITNTLNKEKVGEKDEIDNEDTKEKISIVPENDTEDSSKEDSKDKGTKRTISTSRRR